MSKPRLARRLPLIAVAVVVVLVGAWLAVSRLVLWPTRDVAWGVLGTGSQHRLVVGAPGVYSPCDELKVAVESQNSDAVRIRVRVKEGRCTTKVGHEFGPRAVRLEADIAGRAIDGPRKQALAPEAVTPMPRFKPRTAPSVIGLERADAAAALRAAGFAKVRFVGSGEVAASQTPASGAPFEPTRTMTVKLEPRNG